MTGIWRKNQGFVPETKMQDTHIDYNLVAHFIYIYDIYIYIYIYSEYVLKN